MIQLEKKAIQWIEEYIVVLFLVIVSALGLLVRKSVFDFVSLDALGYLLDWYAEIDALGGVKALSTQVGNYNVLYQLLVVIMTYLPIEPLHACKVFPVLFDYLLGIAGGELAVLLICNDNSEKRKKQLTFALTYAIIILSPIVSLNSGAWGQCDSIYTFFLVAGLVCLVKEKNIAAFVFFGFSFAAKLQMVFVLPFLIMLYFLEKKFSILHFLIIPLVAFLVSLPAVIARKDIWIFLEVYLGQTKEFELMSMNIPNLWVLAGGDFSYMQHFAILLTIGILGTALFYMMMKKHSLAATISKVELACWSVWTCAMFLPAMHERYAYVAEILFLVLVVYNLRRYGLICFVAQMATIMTYGSYLWGNAINHQFIGICYVLAYCGYTYIVFNRKKEDGNE